MTTVASVPSSVATQTSSAPTDQKSPAGDSTAFVGLLNTGKAVSPGSSGSADPSALPAPSVTQADATTGSPSQDVLAQVQSLLQSGVSESTIASTIAQAIVAAIQAKWASVESAGSAADASTSVPQSAQSTAQLVNQIVQYIMQSVKASDGTNQDAKNASIRSAINDMISALSTQTSAQAGFSVAGNQQPINSFLGRIAALLHQLPAMLVQLSGIGGSANGEEFKKHPVQNTQNSRSSAPGITDPNKPNEGRSIALEGFAQASAMLPSFVPASTSENASSQPTAATSDASSSSAAAVVNIAQSLADLSAHVAQLALGLASDTHSSATTDAGQNQSTDPIVRSLGIPVSTVSSSDLLLRTLERATNAAILRGESVNGIQSGTSDILGAIQNALRQLAANGDGESNGTAKFAGSDMLSAAVASPAQSAAAPAGLANSGLGTGQQQPNTNATTATTLAGTDDLHNIISQIVTGISVRDISSVPTVRISLSPPQLGEVVVHLSVGADQNVSATITTSTAEARATVLANIPELNRSLQASGLKLSYLGVDLSNQGMQYEQKQQDKNAQNRGNRTSGVIAPPEAGGQETPVGPSLLNTVNLQLLNQLV